MIDKKLEKNIKKAKEFNEIWGKFRRLFQSALSENYINEKKEKEFFLIKSLVNSRYDDLMDSLGVKPLRRFTMSPFVYNVLSLEKLSIMSDAKLKGIDADWEESRRFLEALLRRLEKKKKRIKEFNRFAFVVKKGMNKLK